MRRNLLIAGALARDFSPSVILLIAGAREVNAFDVPPGVDSLSLPALRKEGNGEYQARHLDLSLSELIDMRARSIAAALEAFLVDKVPQGAVNELDPALTSLRANGRTRCVLGLRDVQDEPAAVCREWREAGGDPAVYDPVVEYGFPPEVAAKVRFTGYLDQHRQTRLADIDGGRGWPLGCRNGAAGSPSACWAAGRTEPARGGVCARGLPPGQDRGDPDGVLRAVLGAGAPPPPGGGQPSPAGRRVCDGHRPSSRNLTEKSHGVVQP